MKKYEKNQKIIENFIGEISGWVYEDRDEFYENLNITPVEMLNRCNGENKYLLENFVIYATHCSHPDDSGYYDPIKLSTEEMYRILYDYIEDDHIDGKDNPENHVDVP